MLWMLRMTIILFSTLRWNVLLVMIEPSFAACSLTPVAWSYNTGMPRDRRV